MKRAARRRHLLFFSTSVAAHLLFVLAAVGVAFIVSDTPRPGSDHPLVVSLDRGEETGDISAPETAPREIAAPVKVSVPFTTKVSGDTEGPGNPIEVGEPGGVSGITGPEDGGDTKALPDYIRSVRARIDRHKHYPSDAARDGIEGTVTVSFLLDRRGTLLEKGIAVGSGHPVLDKAALAAIGDSSPFPPFPNGLERERLLLKLPITYRRR
ncbi:MAG: energy transducer TonB [Deltaproteobacteria bacterium]|nr:energy transducer TonB [Candidatus Zymogenaceae bacterium]